MVVGQGMVPALAGIGIGVAAAAGLGQFLAGILYQLAPRDPAVFLSIPAILAVVAFGSALIPARRATKVDPLLALRRE
jgi:ABC-type antimicrobial peptide transport system permease subunit